MMAAVETEHQSQTEADNDELLRATVDACPKCGAGDPFGQQMARNEMPYRFEVSCWSCHAKFELSLYWRAVPGTEGQGSSRVGGHHGR